MDALGNAGELGTGIGNNGRMAVPPDEGQYWPANSFGSSGVHAAARPAVAGLLVGLGVSKPKFDERGFVCRLVAAAWTMVKVAVDGFNDKF